MLKIITGLIKVHLTIIKKKPKKRLAGVTGQYKRISKKRFKVKRQKINTVDRMMKKIDPIWINK